MKPFDALTALHGVRDVLYKCFDRRSHALFELADAIVAADIVPSPMHLSLKPPCILAFGRTLRPYGRDRPMPPWSRSQDRWEAEVVAPVV